jgi:hypothetical protein
MVDVAALLDEGASVLAASREAVDRARRLNDETRELLVTYRSRRLCLMAGGSGNGAPIALLRQLLQAAPGDALCDGCLAFALGLSLQESQALTDALATESLAFPRAALACAGCRRQTLTIRYNPMNAAKPPARAGKSWADEAASP